MPGEGDYGVVSVVEIRLCNRAGAANQLGGSARHMEGWPGFRLFPVIYATKYSERKHRLMAND
jgi:hypothetical protein